MPLDLISSKSLFNKVKDLKREYELTVDKKQEHDKLYKEAVLKKERVEKARIILQAAAESVQQNLQNRINTVVQMALDIVFDNPPKFSLDIVQRRGKTEADILTNGLRPIDSDGGGVVDIITFALRTALWSIKPNRKTFILDEPFRNLSRDLQHKAAEMVKVLSDKLGIQIIMVSHHTISDEYVDKTFVVEKDGNVSIIK